MAGDVVRRVAVAEARQGAVPSREILLGLALTGGTVVLSGLVSALFSPAPNNPDIRADYKALDKPGFTPPDWAFGIWGPLYLALTLSGLRVFTAPRSRHRMLALLHWFGVQGLNALWLVIGFGWRRRGAMAAEAVITVANAAAYAHAARRVDRPAAWLAVPYCLWVGYAALLSEELWRRNR